MLFEFIDNYMRLDNAQEREFIELFQPIDTAKEEVNNTITSYEMRGIQKGIQQGMQQSMQKGYILKARESVLEILKTHFGGVPKSIRERVDQIDAMPTLRDLRKKAILV